MQVLYRKTRKEARQGRISTHVQRIYRFGLPPTPICRPGSSRPGEPNETPSATFREGESGAGIGGRSHARSSGLGESIDGPV